jgi:protoporphyrinogen oxidase
MALTSKQRSKLPASAFAYPKQRKYPVPTKSQATKAGISETTRLRMHRNALARAGQPTTAGSYRHVAQLVRARSGGKVGTVSQAKGTVIGPGYKQSRSARRRK